MTRIERNKAYPAPGYNTKRVWFQWDGKPPRNPSKGEFFLSGADIIAHVAHGNMKVPYHIAIPIDRERCPCCGAIKNTTTERLRR